MRFQDIAVKVKNGDITFDFYGHDVSFFRECFEDYFDDLVKYAGGFGDGKWQSNINKTVEEVNHLMREYYQRKLDHEINEGDIIITDSSEKCHGCGEMLYLMLGSDKLILCGFYDNKINDFNKQQNRCPYENHKSFVGEIKITSKLIFANFFKNVDDTPDCCKYENDWSLNTLIGRNNITNYKCTKNVAFGQMSNMSIGIYVNDNRDSIIVGPSTHPCEYEDYESDEDYIAACSNPVFDGYKLVGHITLDIWRWEATDINTIGEENYHQLVDDNKCRGLVEIDVQHGIWKFEHFYDGIKDDKDYCYSKFTRK